MKKVFAILMSVTMLLAILSGCGSDSGTSSGDSAESGSDGEKIQVKNAPGLGSGKGVHGDKRKL